MRYADPVAQAEIDRLRAVLHVAHVDAWNLAQRLLSCRKAGDEMVLGITGLGEQRQRVRKYSP